MQQTDIQSGRWSVVRSVCVGSGGGIAFVLYFLQTCSENREIVEVCLAALTIGAIAIPAGLVAKRMNLRQPEMAVIAFLYLSSFGLPSYYNEESFGKVWPYWDGTIEHYLRIVWPMYHPGVFSFLGSCFSLILGNPVFIANPLSWLAFYLLSRRQWALAAVLAFVAVSLGCVGGYLLSSKYLFTIAPGTQEFKLRFGYYVWLSSLFLVGASGTVRWVISDRRVAV